MCRKDDWRDGIKASDLPSLARLVALVMADYWMPDSPLIRCDDETLMSQTGMKRSAVYAARATLRDRGWLVQVERARQHRSPRWRATLPAQGSTTRTSGCEEGPQGSMTRTSGTQESPQGSTTWTSGAPRGPRGGPDTVGGLKPPPPEPHQDPELVVVERLPGEPPQTDLVADLIATVVNHTPAARGAFALRSVCTQLASAGWTAPALTATLAECNWPGAGPGAVVQALRGFSTPPAPKVTMPREKCTDPKCRAGWLPSAPGDPARPCLLCRPHLVRQPDQDTTVGVVL